MIRLLAALVILYVFMPVSACADEDLALYEELEREKELLGKLMHPDAPVTRIEALAMKGHLDIAISGEIAYGGAEDRTIYRYNEFYRIHYRFIRSIRHLNGAESLFGNCTDVFVKADNELLSVGKDGAVKDSRRDRANYRETCRTAESLLEAFHGIANPPLSAASAFSPMSGRNVIGISVQPLAKTYGVSLNIGLSVPFGDCLVNEGKAACNPDKRDTGPPRAGILPVSFADLPVPECRNPLDGMKDITVDGYFPGTTIVAKILWHFDNYCNGSPAYKPGYWNDGPGVEELVRTRRCDKGIIQCRNNCYNYATNRRTDTFAQPGLRAGVKLEEQDYTCEQVYNAAIADGLRPLDASGSCPPGTTKVALTVRPGRDYHWYRQDKHGMWSQKMSTSPATNLDNAYRLIANPEDADTGKYEFCSYLCTCSDTRQGQGHADIWGDKDELRE